MINHCAKLALISLLTLAIGCKKKCEIDFNFPEKQNPNISSSNIKDDLGAILKNAAAKPEVFTVNATTGGQFTSSKGITYTIDPGIFQTQNGETVQGIVTVAVSEITKPSEMILNDMPTNAIVEKDTIIRKDSIKAEQGGMLNSFGEVKIEASQNEEKLSLNPDAEIEVKIPQVAVPEPIIATDRIPVWGNRPVTEQNVMGHDSENLKVTGETTGLALTETCIEWIETPQVCQNIVTVGEPCVIFDVPKLDVWFNSDILIKAPSMTTVLGYFTNIFNDAQTADSLKGRQANMLFFKKKGDNAVMKLYSIIRNAQDGKKGFLSYQNSFGIGMEGTFIALVSKDGKYYAQKKAVTIGEPESGKTYFGVNFTLSEISQSEMLALIESMSNE